MYSTRKFLTDDELYKILHEDDADNQVPIESDDGDISEEDNEVIAHSDHCSDSEQGFTPEDTVVSEDKSESEEDVPVPAYYGKNKCCKWERHDLSNKSRIKGKNIVKIFPGPKAVARGLTTEIAAFDKMIDTFMIDNIVQKTNLFIDYKKDTVQYQRERDTKHTTRSEIMALFGALYLIGIKKENHTNVLELWTADGTGIALIRAVMSYKRFLFLLRCIRFDDRSTRSKRREYDKLAAIRETLDAFVNNCKSNYSLGEFVTIDEKLEGFRGRCGFIQYIPNKPAKYGIKYFVLCDAKTYYTNNLEVYCGRQPDGPYKNDNSPSEIVNRLVSHIKGSNRNLTTDNWYTSYPLAMSLLKDKITLIGTLRKNKREIPKEFLPQKNRDVHSSIFGYQKDITLVSYVPKKNKSVILLSSMHDSGTIDEETKKPDIILDYNATKGGVDTVDQLCGTYSVKRKTRRWPLIVFFSIMDIAGINAQVLFFSNKENMTIPRRIFLKNLAMSLMKPHLIERAKILTLPQDIKVFLRQYREIEEPRDMEPGRKKRGTCVTCGRAKNLSTTISCQICGKFVCKTHATIKISCEICEEEQSATE